jgi:hypothetical protein
MVIIFMGVADDDRPFEGSVLQVQDDIDCPFVVPEQSIAGAALRNAVYFWLGWVITPEFILSLSIIRFYEKIQLTFEKNVS